MQFVTRLTVVACAAVCVSAAPGSFLVFEPAGGKVSAVARSPHGLVAFDSDGALLVPGQGSPVRMRLTGARQASPELLDRQTSYSNYIVGRDASKWRTNVPHFAKVRYRSVLPGIDVVYYGNGGKLEYDFVVAPGANPDAIQIAFEGADRVHTSRDGDLLVETAGGVIRHLRPRVYQTVGGRQIEIAGGYRLKTNNRVEFALTKYDRSRELIVDPVVQFTSYVGGGGRDTGVGVAADGSGNVYVAGESNSLAIGTSSAFQSNRTAETDAYVAKYTNSGALLWLTYFGGSRQESALGVAADASGSVYITGFTYSPDLPARGARTEPGGGAADSFDSFVAKISGSGNSLNYATYLGGNGNDWAIGIAADREGGAWVTGWTNSANFPVQGAYQGGTAGGGSDVFLTRVAPNGNTFTYSTYFGGEGRDLGTSVTVDAAGSVYVGGTTTSSALPLVRSAQTRNAGGSDAFVFKLNPARNELVFSTLIGGSGDDAGIGVGADEAGNAYVMGYTQSANFPVTRGSAQSSIGGGYDIFVAKVEEGTVGYATFVGGNGDDWAGGIAVDAAGTAYIAGWTNSPNFPVRNATQTSYMGGSSTSTTQRFDAVSARVSPAGDSLLYSTYLGGRGEDKAYGIALDRGGQIWIAGWTNSADLPSRANEAPGGETDAFLARLSADAAVALLSAQPSSVRATVRLGDTSATPISVALRATAGSTQFTAASNVAWIQVSPQSGTAPANLTVTINPAQLVAGENRAEITVRSVTNTVTIPVILNVVAAPVIRSTDPAVLTLGTQNTVVTIAGGGFTPASTVEVNDTPAIATYIDPQTLRVTIPQALARTEGTIRIVVINPDARSVTYNLRVASDAPTITAAGIVSAATWMGGPVSPGQLVIIGGSGFGADPLTTATPSANQLGLTLAGTRVLFDGEAAPILWARSGQVAAVVPFSVAGRSATQVAVEYQGRTSATVPVAVQAAAPGLFTANGSGTGQISAFNEDGSVNAQRNPAERGSVLVLYATGLGAISPQLADGAIVPGADVRPQLPVTVVIGGQAAAVEYVGGVPGQVAGLYQLNVRVPIGIPTGDAAVVVFAGNFSSPNAGVTAAVR